LNCLINDLLLSGMIFLVSSGSGFDDACVSFSEELLIMIGLCVIPESLAEPRRIMGAM
jgi:hypothetical protein